MKKIIVLSITLGVLVCTLGFSQNWIIGGDVGFGFGSRKMGGGSDSTTSLIFSPIVGYVINDKIDLGAKLIFESASADASAYIKSLDLPDAVNLIMIAGGDTTTFGLAAWGRYYLLGLGNLELRAKGEIGFTNTSFENIDPDAKVFYIEVLPNFEYRFTNRVSIYTDIGGVKFRRMWTDSDTSETSFIVSAVDTFNLGFFLRF